ncbi:hypothetical protein EDC04DRAFT_2602760 [Pisolithus marmoratus]|nr:hypothetical protein EDC04DRAFT_2602760 [Pisolithus marmoratus]
MASSQNLNFSNFPNSLDIPNSDWNDADDPPQSRRHTKSQNDFVREWLPWRAEYLNVNLEGEQLAKAGICEQCEEAEGSVWCMSCAGVHSWCGPCAVKAHRNLPFHKVQRWNGTHYEPTCLMVLGFLWHIGHGGDPCPRNSSDPDPDESGYMTGEEPPNHRQRLFPASISKTQTAFTFAVLDHFLIDALECKTSAMSFYQKLKRFTNNAFPERDRYRELMRVSQLWRDLKHSKWFGFGHDMEQDPGDGGLALFCPACPQICQQTGKSVMTDGNFTAQHIKMNKPELDVALSDGNGYMVAEVPYQSHLKQSLDSKEISRKGRESITKALVIYDVGYQWSINFRSRVKNSPSLLLPPALEIVPALGKFHLAAHKLSCFPRSMTQAHKQEVYDDHMRDSNWKKLVGMAPTCQEVWLQLMKNSKSPSGNVGSVAWLAEGISIEDSQDQLRSEIQQLPSPMLTRQAVKISEKRQRLSSRIEKFHSNGQAFCKGLDIDGSFTPQDDPAFCGSDEEEHEDREFWDDDEGDWEAPEEEVEGLALELMNIWMPSSIGAAKLTELGLHDLLKEERELRIGQANDCLDQLRTDLGNKAMLEGTRTKKEIQKVVARVGPLAQSKGKKGQMKEEVSLVRCEMLWTGLWFEYHKKMWEQRALQSAEPGKEAYAKKQMGLWSDFASKARLMFHGKQMDGI